MNYPAPQYWPSSSSTTCNQCGEFVPAHHFHECTRVMDFRKKLEHIKGEPIDILAALKDAIEATKGRSK